MKFVLIPIVLIVLIRFVFLSTADRCSRVFGLCVSFLSIVLFGLYLFGVCGIGVESWIVEAFGKVGIT